MGSSSLGPLPPQWCDPEDFSFAGTAGGAPLILDLLPADTQAPIFDPAQPDTVGARLTSTALNVTETGDATGRMTGTSLYEEYERSSYRGYGKEIAGATSLLASPAGVMHPLAVELLGPQALLDELSLVDLLTEVERDMRGRRIAW